MPKATFDKIRADKRERLLREAAQLFAERGFAGTDIAELATRAGVSKGSIYTYFESKDDLYLYVCRDGIARSRQAVYGGLDSSWNVYQQIEHIFRAGVRFVRAHPEYVILYVNVASPGMARFAEELSLEVETFTAEHLTRSIRAGVERGDVRPDLDVEVAAFSINSIYITLLESLVSPHFRIRLRQYLGLDALPDAESIGDNLDRIIDHVQGCLRLPSAAESPAPTAAAHPG
ncbi:MAG: TetR/AcrR family transcriptional regulator [Deltaproteobacteria bacterium]|jgi:AcrR family transcriptional regulator|nr:TetR/AcrR family transcriptional regulator [Deltaproteobacteria bacterium]MBW2533123.1 TetR/AcrR family transcriptional regulator [Deltaproteobacteria bacterium]